MTEPPGPLHVETLVAGAGDGVERRRLVLLHGFTQNGRCWEPFATALAERLPTWSILAVDLPGHGRSHHDTADLPTAAGLVVDATGPAHYLGYSMGGRVLLHAAVARRPEIRSITLVGATAGLDDASDRADRRAADDRLAARLEADGVARFLDDWLRLPLFADLPPEAAARSERERNRAEGLASSLRHTGTGTQEPLWSALAEVEAPTLVVAGNDDAKFTTIGRRIESTLPGARFVGVPGGHAVHLEAPGATAEVVGDFLSRFDPPTDA